MAAPRIVLELVAARRWRGDHEMGTLLARLNPHVTVAAVGEDLLYPSEEDLLAFDRRLGGLALSPDDPATPGVFAGYWSARR